MGDLLAELLGASDKDDAQQQQQQTNSAEDSRADGKPAITNLVSPAKSKAEVIELD